MTISGSATLTQRDHDLDADIDYGVAKGLDAAISNAIAKANTDLLVEFGENEWMISISFAHAWTEASCIPGMWEAHQAVADYVLRTPLPEPYQGSPS